MRIGNREFGEEQDQEDDWVDHGRILVDLIVGLMRVLEPGQHLVEDVEQWKRGVLQVWKMPQELHPVE